MNSKYLTFEYIAIAIWELIFGLWALIIILGKHLIPINGVILIAGILMMIHCAINEEKWFPSEPRGEEEK